VIPTVGPLCLWCWSTSSLLLGLGFQNGISFYLDELNYLHGGEGFGFVHQGPDL
jgi:hypothetical protein